MREEMKAYILHWLGRLRRFIHTRQQFYLFGASTRDGKPEWLDQSNPSGLDSDIDMSFRVGEEKDLDLLSDLAGARKVELMRLWLKDGHRVYIASDGDRVVYYEWVAFHDFYDSYLGITVRVKEDECFAFDALTHPDYKLKNILRAASSKIALDCHYNMGRQKIMAYVNAERWPLFVKLYRISGLGTVRAEAVITRRRILGVWRSRIDKL